MDRYQRSALDSMLAYVLCGAQWNHILAEKSSITVHFNGNCWFVRGLACYKENMKKAWQSKHTVPVW